MSLAPIASRNSSIRIANELVKSGEADAVVFDEALLKFLGNTTYAESIQVLPISFNTQEYAIALHPNSDLRKPINETLLQFRASDSWDELLYRYLGD